MHLYMPAHTSTHTYAHMCASTHIEINTGRVNQKLREEEEDKSRLTREQNSSK